MWCWFLALWEIGLAKIVVIKFVLVAHLQLACPVIICLLAPSCFLSCYFLDTGFALRKCMWMCRWPYHFLQAHVVLLPSQRVLLFFVTLRSTETEPLSVPFKGVVDLKELSSVRPRSILLEYESQLQPVQPSKQTMLVTCVTVHKWHCYHITANLKFKTNCIVIHAQLADVSIPTDILDVYMYGELLCWIRTCSCVLAIFQVFRLYGVIERSNCSVYLLKIVWQFCLAQAFIARNFSVPCKYSLLMWWWVCVSHVIS